MRRKDSSLQLFAGLCWLLSVGCRTRVSEPIDRSAVAFAGCESVWSGPRCVLTTERELRVWLPTWQPVIARSNGHRLATRSERRQDGTLLRMAIPPGATSLVLTANDGSSVLELRLLDSVLPPALARAIQQRARGEFAAARRTLEAAMPGFSESLVWRARSLLARVALSEGDLPGALSGLRSALERAYREGRLSDALEDASALAYLSCMHSRDFGEARALLAQAAERCSEDPSARALLPYYQAIVSRESGDPSGALASFGQASALIERIDLREHAALAREASASTLAYLGRHADAVREQERVAREFDSQDACKQSDRYEAVAWLALLSEPAPGSELAASAARASDLAGQILQGCPSPWRQRNHAINAALLALQSNDLASAQAWLDRQAQVELRDPVLDTWQTEARARLQLARGELREARASFERAQQLAEHHALWENQHLALIGEARVHVRSGRDELALQAYRAAEALLSDVLGFVPVSEGQAGFQRAREAGTRELVALAVRLGRERMAFEVARVANTRVLASVSRQAAVARLDPGLRARWESAIGEYRARRDTFERAQSGAWRVPANQLPAYEVELARQRAAARSALDEAYALLARPGSPSADARKLEPGELVLAYFPAPSGFWAFAASAGATRALAFPPLSPGLSRVQQAGLLLTPFLSELREARRVRVINAALLPQLDVHALELDGAPLGERVPVSYMLDLGAAPDPPPTAAGRALIVANPAGDLAEAELEAQSIRRHLGLDEGALSLRGAATRARVLSALSSLELFHFAGHVKYAGVEGIDSALLLADGELSLGEILSLPDVPRTVVLSASEGARSDGHGFAAGLGLAQAFIASGAQEIVAAARPVRDGLARGFIERFYRAWAAHPELGCTEAVRQAQRELRAEQPAEDWAAFRVLTR